MKRRAAQGGNRGRGRVQTKPNGGGKKTRIVDTQCWLKQLKGKGSRLLWAVGASDGVRRVIRRRNLREKGRQVSRPPSKKKKKIDAMVDDRRELQKKGSTANAKNNPLRQNTDPARSQGKEGRYVTFGKG